MKLRNEQLGGNGEKLVWSPIATHLTDRCAAEGGIRLLIAPFIQRDAFRHLVQKLTSNAEMKVITRWNASDLASGVSDPFVYEECRDRHIPLYVHSSIHLKLITLGSGLCLCSSANITAAGLGLHDHANVEAGSWAYIGSDDWLRVYEIINGSRVADQALFSAAVEYRNKHLHAAPPLPPLELPPSPPIGLTLTSLPATLSPADVADFAAAREGRTAPDGVDVNRLMHDVVHFATSTDGDRDAILRGIGEQFLKQPFVMELVDHVRASGSLRFGEMTAWIHAHCRDVPVPYRWEVKDATRALYNWLAFFVPEITWSVPGHRSQVICWSEHPSTD